jgi:hypothetical protein
MASVSCRGPHLSQCFNSDLDNTLAPYDTCTNSNVDSIGYYGDSFVSEWESVYLADAVKRLQPHARGLNLTTGLLADMQSLCAYEVTKAYLSDIGSKNRADT